MGIGLSILFSEHRIFSCEGIVTLSPCPSHDIKSSKETGDMEANGDDSKQGRKHDGQDRDRQQEKGQGLSDAVNVM